MKAILVIDMPTHCGECPIKCRMRGITHVPTWCPLKPLPPKLDENDWHRMFSGVFSEREAKGRGWNACLEEIEK